MRDEGGVVFVEAVGGRKAEDDLGRSSESKKPRSSVGNGGVFREPLTLNLG